MVYLPTHFEETRPAVISEVIRTSPLATLVTFQHGAPCADHIPLLLDPERGPHGTLIGHVARNNTLWHDHDPDVETLAIFQAADAYISPNWYPTKAETHEVVPTWNYVVVHAGGPLVIHDDEKWVRGVVGKLTKAMEQSEPVPWKMADAPQAYLREMLGNIVGIEIPVVKLTGKWKASQNRTPQDRDGAIAGLDASGDPRHQAMIEQMRRFGGE